MPRSCIVAADVDKDEPGTLVVSSVGKVKLGTECFDRADVMTENGVLYVSSKDGSFYEIDINAYSEEEPREQSKLDSACNIAVDYSQVGDNVDKERVKEMCVKYVLQQAQLARVKLELEQR